MGKKVFQPYVLINNMKLNPFSTKSSKSMTISFRILRSSALIDIVGALHFHEVAG